MFSFLKKLFNIGPSVDLKELIKNGATVVDVRTVHEFDSGHVKGSMNIPLDQLKNHMARLKGKQPIITCCASGMRSGAAKGILKANGIECYNGGSWIKVQGML